MTRTPSTSSNPCPRGRNLFFQASSGISPPPGALRANSSLITPGSCLCCNMSGVPGPICLACLLGSLLSSDAWLPHSPFQALFLSSSFRRSWLLWQPCSGYQVVVGGREPRVPHFRHFRHFRCQAPSRCSGGASWWGVTRASPGLTSSSLAMGGGERGAGMGVRI